MRASHLLPVLLLLAQLETSSTPNDFVEICAGRGNLSKGLRMSGWVGKEFDVLYSGNHNLMRTIGFITILMAVRNTRQGGVVVCGPPCCTWIFLSSSVTGRNWANPEGDPQNQRCVALANILVRRLLYILYYAVKRNVKIVIEQPQSSVPCFSIILNNCPIGKTHRSVFLSC
ncbi:unnamed protein product [Durusdinium trenchii]|uniref:Uncharacterized protein n=2 Tax=Durusdinium trenchii TaxID=1381693 RepID=A0ABP0S1B6_9DINO